MRLREGHGLTIVDTPKEVNDSHLMIVELADELLVTVVADIAALKNTRAYLALLESAGLSRDCRVVLNREGELGGLDTSDCRAAFGPIDYSIADDRLRATRAGNRYPVVVSDRSPRWRAHSQRSRPRSPGRPRATRLQLRRSRPPDSPGCAGPSLLSHAPIGRPGGALTARCPSNRGIVQLD